MMAPILVSKILPAILAVIVMALSAIGFYLFNRNMIRGIERPSTASWNLWVLFTVVNCSSFFAMNGDWIMFALPGLDMVLCIATWAMAFRGGHFEWPPRRDWPAIALTLAALVVWKIFSATDANLFSQIPYVFSFWPCFIKAWKREMESRPWVIWTVAFTINIGLVSLRYKTRYDFAYPVMALLLHFITAVIAWRRPMIKEQEVAHASS